MQVPLSLLTRGFLLAVEQPAASATLPEMTEELCVPGTQLVCTQEVSCGCLGSV